MGIGGQAADKFGQRGRQLAGSGQLGAKVIELSRGGQLAVPQQVDHFFVVGVGGQVIYVVAAVQQPALLAIQKADVLPANHGVFESGGGRSQSCLL